MNRLCLLLFLISCIACAAFAESVVQYHTIRKGETLSSLARRYGVSVEQLKSWNNIQSGAITQGQRIIVKKSTIKTTADSASPGYYTVKKGDTLSSISKKTGLSTEKIKKYNGLGSSRLQVGQKLSLTPKEKTVAKRHVTDEDAVLSAPQETVPEIRAAEGPSPHYVEKTYVVRKGDTLSKVAKKNHTTVSALRKLNRLKSSAIHPGSVIVVRREVQLPPPVINPTPIVPVAPKVYYQVKLGDTLESIAARFGISVDALRETNLLSDGRIKIGQTLVIPGLAGNREGAGTDTSLSMADTENSTSSPGLLTLKILESAFKFLNTPYSYGKSSKDGTDCSGLTKMVYEDVGITLPHSSREQFKIGDRTTIDEAKPGDLVFFQRGGKIRHVGIYIGDNKFIHASSEARKVVVADLDDSYFRRHFVGVKSYFEDDTSTETGESHVFQ
jgi:LysM repeat protein